MDVIRRLWRRWTYKPFECGGCGTRYRNEPAVAKCLWRHYLDPGVEVGSVKPLWVDDNK